MKNPAADMYGKEHGYYTLGSMYLGCLESCNQRLFKSNDEDVETKPSLLS